MAQIAVSASIDSFMDYASPTTNYGAGSTINQGVLIAGGTKSQVRRAIANFDVSAVPLSAVINAASMRRVITVPAAGQHGVRIARCTRPAQWTEGGVTWNTYNGTNAWVTGGGEYDDITPAAVSFIETNLGGAHLLGGLAGFVRDAIDLRSGVVSLLLRNEQEAPLVTERSAWLAGASWQLLIDYNVASEPGRRSATTGGRVPVARPRSPSAGRAPHRPTTPHEGSRP